MAASDATKKNARPAPAAAPRERNQTEKKLMALVTRIANASQRPIADRNGRHDTVLKSTAVRTPHSRVPARVDPARRTRSADSFAMTSAVRERGFVIAKIAVPVERSPEIDPAPPRIRAKITSWLRFLRNCVAASRGVAGGRVIVTPGCDSASEEIKDGATSARIGLVRPKNSSSPGITQIRQVRRIS